MTPVIYEGRNTAARRLQLFVLLDGNGSRHFTAASESGEAMVSDEALVWEYLLVLR
jgi:hypothetical protein